MAIVNTYVSLPEGKIWIRNIVFGDTPDEYICVCLKMGPP